MPALPLGAARGSTCWHVIIQIFIWSFVGNAWSLMGRFGLVSLGHGAFLGVGAYTTALLWNFFGLTPWIGAVVAVAAHGALAAVVAYPCSRFQVVGHYFAPRDAGGGRGGPPADHRRARLDRRLARADASRPAGAASACWTLQFADKRVFYYGALVALGRSGSGCGGGVDRAWPASAMEAIGEDETAAASVGIHVTRFKIGITVLSAALTALGGVAATRSTSRT